MNSCEGCLISSKGQNEAYGNAKSQARKWVNDNKKAVAIWQEGYEFYYGDAEDAISAGKVVKEIISYR